VGRSRPTALYRFSACAVPLVVVAWWRPLIGGALVALIGIALTAVFTLGGPGDPQMDPSANLFVYAVRFARAIVGGVLPIAAGWVKARET
jgi:hypothetical protein